MKDGRFRMKSQGEIEALSFEEKNQYFQELLQELQQREKELEQTNLELAGRRGRKTGKPGDSPNS